MAHVVLHCAEFESESAAGVAAAGLDEFRAATIAYERQLGGPAEPPDPPLVEFAKAHGFALHGACEVLVKGPAEDTMQVLQVDRLVFFYAGGFDLGGDAIETYFSLAGASHYSRDTAQLVVASENPQASARSLASFLDDEEYAEQYYLAEAEAEVYADPTPFSVRFETADTSLATAVIFDDSGVQDWAFIACLPQLHGQAPRLAAPPPRAHLGLTW